MKKIKEQKGLTKSKIRIIATLKGDGAIFITSKTNYCIKLECKDEELLKQFKSDIMSTYGLETKRFKNISGKTGKEISMEFVRSKLAYEDLIKYGPYKSDNWIIPEIIFNSQKELKRELIRTFADNEGSVCNNLIKIYSINLKGLKQVKKLIEEFDIGCRIKGGFGCKRNVFAIIISGKKNVIKYRDIIGFSLKRKQDKLLNM